MNIRIEFIPAEQQRYKTVGDWQVINNELVIRISNMGEASFPVAIHELIEAWLCIRNGVTAEMVDEDDSKPIQAPYEEHGDMPTSRYHKQHDFAWCIERMIAHEMDLDWTLYEEELDKAYELAGE